MFYNIRCCKMPQKAVNYCIPPIFQTAERYQEEDYENFGY